MVIGLRRTRRTAGVAAAAIAALGFGSAGCFNGGGVHNSGVMGGGGRFALVIEAGRTPIEGTHFLVDTATGDLWRLDDDAKETGRWLRVSDGPIDVAALELPAFVGVETADMKRK